MSRTQKLFTSRQNNLNADTFIGEHGRLFYDEPANPGIPPLLRYSDGVTVGGIPFAVSTTISNNSNVPPYRTASMWWNSDDGNLYIGYNDQWVPATASAGNGGGITTLASYTVSQLTGTSPSIVGSLGSVVAVSDASGGNNVGGMMAFWDTTNTRWSYIMNNLAV